MTSDVLQNTSTEEIPHSPKRMRLDADYMLPVPKRQTLASQQRQYKKLITPFRSPLLLKDQDFLCEKGIPAPASAQEVCDGSNRKEREHPSNYSLKSKPGTRKSGPAAQFKSPVIRSGNDALDGRASIRLTPVVQMLEHRLQLLRRAVKVKEDDNDEALAQLVKKWTEAGREVAYGLWDLVKDTGDVQSNSSDFSSFWSRGVDSAFVHTHWGWDKPAGESESTKQDTKEDEQTATQMADDKGEQPRNTMGTMLRQLRIDPETLGWDDDTETFLD